MKTHRRTVGGFTLWSFAPSAPCHCCCETTVLLFFLHCIWCDRVCACVSAAFNLCYVILETAGTASAHKAQSQQRNSFITIVLISVVERVERWWVVVVVEVMGYMEHIYFPRRTLLITPTMRPFGLVCACVCVVVGVGVCNTIKLKYFL